jgi:DNA-binding beta-propeller fold protein YncE
MNRLMLSLFLLIWSTVHAQRQAYVVNNLAETLSMIDLDDETVENHIVVLGETPNQVVYHDDYLYVVNSISADVQKIDRQTHQPVADIYLPVGSNPYFIAFGQDFAYVTGWVSGKVYEIDLSSNEVGRELEIGGYPEGIIFCDDRLYVTQTYFDPDDFSYGQGRIAIIDAAAFTLETRIDVGKNPQWISRVPDGRLHIVCTGNYSDIEGSIYIFDPVFEAVVDSILIGGQPASLAMSSAGIGYLAAGGWIDHGYIYSYDIQSGDIIHGPSNPILAGLGVTWVAVDSLGFVYSCDFGDDTVSKLSPSGGMLGSFNMGDGPVSITIVDDVIIWTEREENAVLPDRSGLPGNYPNPFNSGTLIRYELRSIDPAPSTVEIYDTMGRRVKSLRLETADRKGSVYWDGTDDKGGECASGWYFARLADTHRSGDEIASAAVVKMMMLR